MFDCLLAGGGGWGSCGAPTATGPAGRAAAAAAAAAAGGQTGNAGMFRLAGIQTLHNAEQALSSTCPMHHASPFETLFPLTAWLAGVACLWVTCLWPTSSNSYMPGGYREPSTRPGRAASSPDGADCRKALILPSASWLLGRPNQLQWERAKRPTSPTFF